jgi:mgtE-like transporter
MFKDATIACLIDLVSLIPGFIIALQLGIFSLSPWALALYPAVISVKAIITGLLTGRLSTALHLGTMYPQFLGNTKSFYRLIGAMIVLTLGTSATISAFAFIFGTMFWGVNLNEFGAILSVMVATLSLGLLVALTTVQFTFISFKRSLDPDTIVYPAVSTLANIVITFLYLAVLHVYFSGATGRWAIIFFGLINVFLVLFILPHNIRNRDFLRILKESLPTMVLVAFMVNITGTLFKGISNVAGGRRDIYTVYPAMIDMMGDAGLVVSSAATVKLTLGVLSPSLGSVSKHAKNIFSAWASTLLLFMVLGGIALAINGMFSVWEATNLLLILLVSNVMAFASLIGISYVVAILTYKRGLDPDNFVIPLGIAFADALTTFALFAALLLIG